MTPFVVSLHTLEVFSLSLVYLRSSSVGELDLGIIMFFSCFVWGEGGVVGSIVYLWFLGLVSFLSFMVTICFVLEPLHASNFYIT